MLSEVSRGCALVKYLQKCCLFETAPVWCELINSSIKFEEAHFKVKAKKKGKKKSSEKKKSGGNTLS